MKKSPSNAVDVGNVSVLFRGWLLLIVRVTVVLQLRVAGRNNE
jgi:hypothetical protein